MLKKSLIVAALIILSNSLYAQNYYLDFIGNSAQEARNKFENWLYVNRDYVEINEAEMIEEYTYSYEWVYRVSYKKPSSNYYRRYNNEYSRTYAPSPRHNHRIHDHNYYSDGCRIYRNEY